MRHIGDTFYYMSTCSKITYRLLLGVTRVYPLSYRVIYSFQSFDNFGGGGRRIRRFRDKL